MLEEQQREMQAAHASELEALRSHADAQERSASTLRSRVDAVRSQSKDDMAASVAAADEEKRRLEAETAQRAQEMEEQMSAMQAAHESELRALLSFGVNSQPAEPQVWGLFTALPEGTTLNVNTAPPQVLDAVIGNVAGTAGVQAVLDARKEEPITDISTVMQLAPFNGLSADEKNDLASLLGVSSEYFQVMVDVEVDGQLSRLVSRLHRASGQGETTSVFSRQVSPLLTPLEPACNPFYNANGN